MSRDAAIARSVGQFDHGGFLDTLARRVAMPTESQRPDHHGVVRDYLTGEIGPELTAMGFEVSIHENDDPRGGPFLVARRIEDPALPTVLGYGHADVVNGLDEQWRDGLSPWVLTREGDFLYGRGTADNKGQHSVNLVAQRSVIEERGRLGFNAVWLMETSEEIGSPGLHDFCRRNRELLRADVLMGSDGPRCQPHRPTIFGGGRGSINFQLRVDLRDGGHHSGNWGGLIANPGVLLAHAISTIISSTGRVLVPDLCPREVPESVRRAIADVDVGGGEGAPEIDPWWGETELSPAARVLTWNAFEVLAFETGTPAAPVNAVPGSAVAHCQIRYTVDSDAATFLPAIRRHLDRHGLDRVEIVPATRGAFVPSRLEPDSEAVRLATASIEATTGARPALMPNIGGSLPNDAFTDILGLQTLWIPHSYTGCRQHGANEHAKASILREGLAIMTGLFWDVGEESGRLRPA